MDRAKKIATDFILKTKRIFAKYNSTGSPQKFVNSMIRAVNIEKAVPIILK